MRWHLGSRFRRWGLGVVVRWRTQVSVVVPLAQMVRSEDMFEGAGEHED